MKTIHLACQYFLNYDLEEQEIRRQVKMLADAGYESIYCHARQGLITPYFSKKYWDCIRAMADECKKNNICIAIWDEDCFPSGVAGNRIVWEHPELSVKHLEFSIFEAKKGERIYEVLPVKSTVLGCFTVSDDGIENITGYCGSIRGPVKWRARIHQGYSNVGKIPMPHWRAGWRGRSFALDYDAEKDCRIVVVQAVYYTDPESLGNNTDLMDPETTRLFIQLTHEEYKKQCGEELFNSTFDASFLDEPNPGFFYCWSTHFAEEFEKMHGFDLIPKLPHLVLDIDDDTLFIRHCYRMTQQKLITENYLGQIRKWCRENNIISTGHLSRSEFLSFSNCGAWPNEMKCYSFLDIPCTDPLGAGEAWSDANAYHTGIKVAVSAALIYDKQQAGADTLAVLGHEASIRDLVFHLDYQMMLGLTYFNIHGLSYSLAMDRKDEVPPSIFYQHTQWQWMKEFLSRAGEWCKLISSGKPFCQTAMLYPCATFYCATRNTENSPWEEKVHQLVEKMLSHHKDFIFIDEDAVCRMMDEDAAGFIRRYPFFVIPSLRYLQRKVADTLQNYADMGGKVIVTGDLPLLFGSAIGEKNEVWSGGKKFRCSDFLSLLPGEEITGDGASDILLQQRLIGDRLLTVFFNRAEKPFTGKFNGEDIYLAPGCGTLHMAGDPLPAAPEANTEPAAAINQWNITFPDNHIALPYWQLPGDLLDASLQVQLLERKLPDTGKFETLDYSTTFLFSGDCEKIELLVEKDDMGGSFRCLVNGVEITGFAPANYSDICFIAADITHALKTGNSPKLNKIELIPAPGGELREVPFLRGKFKAEHRHSGFTLPFLQGFDGKVTVDVLHPWSAMGYGTFSGTVEYSSTISIDTAGKYLLDLGKVEDLAEVSIDGQKICTLFKHPYVTGKFALSAGKHSITIKVANGPGNRDRLAGLPSGIIGTVKLLKANR